MLSVAKNIYWQWQINEWVWHIHGMILTEDSHSFRRKTCPNATLSTTGIELGPPLWETGNWLPKPWHGLDQAWFGSSVSNLFCSFISPQFCWRWKQKWPLNCFLASLKPMWWLSDIACCCHSLLDGFKQLILNGQLNVPKVITDGKSLQC